MPNVSPQFVQFLKSQVKRKSYRVYRKRHKPVAFTSYDDALAYCIKHQLDHTSSWVLTTINHCA